MSKTMRRRATFKKFDVADHLKTEEDIRAYLNVAAESGDMAELAGALGDVTRARNQMSKMSRETGLSRQGLMKALSAKGNPRLDTVGKIASSMGFRLSFEPAAKPKKSKTHAAR